ncbi:helix-turn-helix domain-containing protein [Krasilnikovia sp. MM14-A1004]|uniref:helix-turn-helix domain-containing protein n=1 Tax=Krasilnikovia sp. MM14-A1004 TaxID=3373541 RepID=UPI00399D2725
MSGTAQLQDFAARLRSLRARSGMTLRELQAVTYASDSALSRYLAGRGVPPWKVVAAICEQAGADAAELRPHWERARAVRRGRVEPPPPLVELSAVEGHLARISDEVSTAIEETLARGDQVPRHLLAVQRSGADARVRLRAAQRLLKRSS